MPFPRHVTLALLASTVLKSALDSDNGILAELRFKRLNLLLSVSIWHSIYNKIASSPTGGSGCGDTRKRDTRKLTNSDNYVKRAKFKEFLVVLFVYLKH